MKRSDSTSSASATRRRSDRETSSSSWRGRDASKSLVGVESFDRAALNGAHKGQNHPETYDEIVRLCRDNGITSHFSNIIGFPNQTRIQVLEHLDVLRGMAPNLASFYILTPIPGTEQYADLPG